MTRTLAVDYGRRRIGLALCDALGVTVRPLPALHHENASQTLRRLQQLCHMAFMGGMKVGDHHEGHAGIRRKRVEQSAQRG